MIIAAGYEIFDIEGEMPDEITLVILKDSVMAFLDYKTEREECIGTMYIH